MESLTASINWGIIGVVAGSAPLRIRRLLMMFKDTASLIVWFLVVVMIACAAAGVFVGYLFDLY